jgi:hypothetical protein
MHGEDDAFHMFNLHTKLVHNKEIQWSELENMIPFQKEAYINILVSTIKEETNQSDKSSLEL